MTKERTHISDKILFHYVTETDSVLTYWSICCGILKHYISTHGFTLISLNYIFCADAYLLELNREHLNHDYYTDIFTFDQSDETENIEADIFISVERATENAQAYQVPVEQEIKRLLIHGLLHLLGYDDHIAGKKALMKAQEDVFLNFCK